MSRLKLSRDSGFSSKIGTIPPNSDFFLGGGVRGFRGHAPPEKIRNLRSSNCWKCIEIINPIINVLFLYHFKYFTIPSGGGGGCVRTPPLPTGLMCA